MTSNIVLINPTSNFGDLLHRELNDDYQINITDNTIFDKKINLHKMVKEAKAVVFFLNYPVNIIRPLLVQNYY